MLGVPITAQKHMLQYRKRFAVVLNRVSGAGDKLAVRFEPHLSHFVQLIFFYVFFFFSFLFLVFDVLCW